MVNDYVLYHSKHSKLVLLKPEQCTQNEIHLFPVSHSVVWMIDTISQAFGATYFQHKTAKCKINSEVRSGSHSLCLSLRIPKCMTRPEVVKPSNTKKLGRGASLCDTAYERNLEKEIYRLNFAQTYFQDFLWDYARCSCTRWVVVHSSRIYQSSTKNENSFVTTSTRSTHSQQLRSVPITSRPFRNERWEWLHLDSAQFERAEKCEELTM